MKDVIFGIICITISMLQQITAPCSTLQTFDRFRTKSEEEITKVALIVL